MSTWTDIKTGSRDFTEIGSVAYHFTVLESTNATAAKLLTHIRPKHGTVISADYQKAGRGQVGRGWHSAPGLNLCLTCILYPGIKAQGQFAISIAVSLAVRDLVAGLIDPSRVTIKWPNDIYVDDRKIAGILIQNAIQGDAITSCIAGIGINVNETDFPAELPNPTSLSAELKSTSTLSRVTLSDTLYALLQSRLTMMNTDPEILSRNYHEVLYRRDKPSGFILPGTKDIRRGVITGVEPSGRLVVKWESGETVSYQHREIELALP